jgi:hypothetical protein
VPESYRVARLHWTKHPLRYDGEIDSETGRPTSDWYRAECKKLILDDAIARELDIDFSKSSKGLVFPEYSFERHVRTDLAYDSNLPLHFGMALVFQVHPTDSIKVRILADYEMENAPAQVNASNLLSVIRKVGFMGDMREVFGHGDPAGNAREIATGSTVIREYRAFGFQNFTTKKVKKSDGIRLVRNMLHRGEIAFADTCEEFPKRVADYRYPTDESGNVKGDEPVKNKATHLCDALRYGMTGVFPVDGSLGSVQATQSERVTERNPYDVPVPRYVDTRPIAHFPERF